MSDQPTGDADIERLLEIMRCLRDPEQGCEWDRKQTFASIVPHTLEEAYEVADAIERGEPADIKSELGDLLFQVVFYAQLGKEQGWFDFSDIVTSIADKLVSRHPHVFADASFADEAQLKVHWEQAKLAERKAQRAQKETEPSESDLNIGLLDNIPTVLPAISQAQKIQTRVGRHGFDWPDVTGVISKIREELDELEQEIIRDNDSVQTGSRAGIEEEYGDLLFACVNLARHLKLDAEASLRGGNRKFIKRFSAMEAALHRDGLELGSVTLATLEGYWQMAKDAESDSK